MPPKTGASFNKSHSRQDWGTPPEFIQAVERRFGKLEVDLAAHQGNHVCEAYLGPGGAFENSLELCWSGMEGNLWLNPPFSEISTWSQKMAVECSARLGWALLLVPDARDTKWYRNNVRGKGFEMPLANRMKFVGASDIYPKGLLLVAYGFNVSGCEPWNWKSGA